MQKILVVDDDLKILKSARDWLKVEYEVLLAGPPTPYETALEIWEQHEDLSLALIDLRMQGVRGIVADEVGFHLIKKFKEIRSDSRIAAYSAYQSPVNLGKAALTNADAFIGKNWPRARKKATVKLLSDWTKASSALSSISNNIIKLRNPYTAGHTTRVRDYCRALIPYLLEATPADGLKNSFDIAACLIAAELHDIGKLGMPDDILLGVDDILTSEQRKVIERHVDAAKDLKDLGYGFDKIAWIAFQHHRRYVNPHGDSTKSDYPKEDLEFEFEEQCITEEFPRGDDIPFEARVMHVADALDAMLSDRSYRPGKSLEDVIEIIQGDVAKGDFDPKVVKALERLHEHDLDTLKRIIKTGVILTEWGIRLYFPDQRLTAGRLDTSLSTLRDITLTEGKAIDCLKVRGIEIFEANQKTLLLDLDDLNNAKALIKKLNDPQDDPLAKHLSEQCPKPLTLDMHQELVDSLNKLIQGDSLHTKARFAHVEDQIRGETKRLLAQEKSLSKEDLIRLNRLLLEAAYKKEIVKHQDCFVVVRLAGTEKDVKLTAETLNARIVEDRVVRAKWPLSNTEIRGLRPVPVKVEIFSLEDKDVNAS